MFLTSISSQGTLKWSYSVGTLSSDLRMCPAIADDGTIYLSSKNEKLTAINPNGTFKWEFETLGIIWSSPAIGSDGTVYLASNISNSNYNAGLTKNFFAINPDGSLKWSVESGIIVDNSPAIGSDGTIYLPSSEGLAAYSPDGTLKWSYPEIGNSYTTPAISSDGTVFIAGWSTFYAINTDGTLKWSIEIEDDTKSSPAIGADGTVYIGSKDNYLYAINPSNGTEKWKFDAGSMVLSAPVIDNNGTIYFGSHQGKFYAVNPDGTEKWFYQFSEDLGFLENHGAIIGDNNVIYFGTSDPVLWFNRKLYAMNMDGTIKWEFASALSIDSPPTIATDGTVYIGTGEGTLLAVYGESTGAANTPWPAFRGNVKNTGLGIDTVASNTAVLEIEKESMEVKCYPNPFSKSTIISFSLTKSENVIIKIYSVLGIEVQTLFEGKMLDGNHSVVFDADNQNAQQIYICKIQTESQTQTSILFQN